ncbi:hypothetical protein [Planctomicrobium sp. SH527]|uniref:hypothetical protein n=1 Tax=Planctomicrobium sp. SH527 TaxID=3448123 RepID=UPI003F5BEE0D
MIQRHIPFLFALTVWLGGLPFTSAANAGQLYVGGSSISITPEERVALAGQMHTRISNKVESPCIATALVIETRNGDQSIEQAIFVSCDIVTIRDHKNLYAALRAKLGDRIPEHAKPKIILSATHTHTAPALEVGSYAIPESGVMHPDEYREFFLEQVATAIADAWAKREPAQVAWGLGHAVVAQNRRSTFANGSAVMYGATNTDKFRGIEGGEDHGVELLYFWNADNKLIGTAVNVSCPAQEVEGRSQVNADFWHPFREQLQEKYGKDLIVVTWCGAAGDQSPHLMYRKQAEERMRKLRNVDTLAEIARRVLTAWEDVYAVVQNDRHSDVPFEHLVTDIKLPNRIITEQEAATSRQAAAGITDPKAETRKQWFLRVAKRYEDQKANGVGEYDMELHAIRLGDIAIATNDFELFTDYGVQMKARSPALQTFVIQLCGRGTYLPTERAVAGGGYSAVPESNLVGPEGGQVLVNETVNALTKLWAAPEKK